jgi:type II secretory pathway predicted ATPase ExeA
MLTGEVGTGKTTLLRCLLVQQPQDVNIALILNPRLNAVELMASICDELRIDYPADTDSLKVLHDALTEYLIITHAQDQRTVLIIDEAQNLSVEVLEQVRLLTNLETTQTKLLQIILVGQPELNRILKSKNLRQVTQRITCRYHLKSFSKKNLTNDYIHHRISVSGGDASKLFTRAAVRKIHRLSGGVPRLINLICHRTLSSACSQQKKMVDAKLVHQTTKEVRPVLVRPWFRKAFYWAPTLAAVFVVGIVAGHYLNPFGLSKPGATPIAKQPMMPIGKNTSDQIPRQKTDTGTLADGADGSNIPVSDAFDESSATIDTDVLKESTINLSAKADTDGAKQSTTTVADASKQFSDSDDADAAKKTTVAAVEASAESLATADIVAVKPSTTPAGELSDKLSAATDVDALEGPTTFTAESSNESPDLANTSSVGRSIDSVVNDDASTALNTTATPTPSETVEALPLFSELIHDSKLTQDEAFTQLLLQWNIQYNPEGSVKACDAALQKRLRCLFTRSNWNFMRRLNRPVILELIVNDYQKRYATLVGLDEHRLTFALGSKHLTFPLDQVLPYWRGRYILLWKPIHQTMSWLQPGNISWMVRRLRRQLAESGMPVSTVTEGASLYDEALQRQVTAFQTSRGINPDGIVGPYTMIHLNTLTNTFEVPLLERGSDKIALTAEPGNP